MRSILEPSDGYMRIFSRANQSDLNPIPLPFQFAHALVGEQAGQQLGGGLRLAGQNQVRGNFRQRFQDKSPKMRPRMRQDELIRVADQITEGNQIQVQRAAVYLPSVSEPRLLALQTEMETVPVGYIQINHFQDSTVQDVKEALAQLQTAGVQALHPGQKVRLLGTQS